MHAMDMSSMGGEHGAALAGLLWLPVAILGTLTVLQAAASRVPLARSAVAATASSPVSVRGAAFLMLMSAAVHVALVPDHSGEPVTAGLFVLDSVALVVLAVAIVLVPAARAVRIAAALVLAAGVAAYGFYLLAGLETADAVGATTKLLELVAIVLCLAPAAIHPRFPEVSPS